MKQCAIFSLQQIVDGKKGIKELEQQRRDLQYKLSLLYTNCLIISRENNYQKIIEYIEPDPQEMVNLNDSEPEIIPKEEMKEENSIKEEIKKDNPNPNKKTGKQTTLF